MLLRPLLLLLLLLLLLFVLLFLLSALLLSVRECLFLLGVIFPRFSLFSLCIVGGQALHVLGVGTRLIRIFLPERQLVDRIA